MTICGNISVDEAKKHADVNLMRLEVGQSWLAGSAYFKPVMDTLRAMGLVRSCECGSTNFMVYEGRTFKIRVSGGEAEVHVRRTK